jgi:(1->4)-alpha-D-glucan 1-alpha-D-glucosylmutase
LSDDLGGEVEFRGLCEAGLGVVLDIVPNHMAATDENPYWADPLVRAKFFDVEWRSGGVRRFFDVDDLAGVRLEDPEVFEATHAKVTALVREGIVDGVRVDHVDGLANPHRYLQRLREAGIEHVWVEKILEPGEPVRDWPVEGTTGYEFANDVTALFVDPSSEDALTSCYIEFTGERSSYDEVAFGSKLEQAKTTFQPEVDWLRQDLAGDDDGLDLARAVASFGIYRTYVEPDTAHVDGLDRQAVATAQLPRRLAAILLLEERGHDAFVVRFQQTTPPVTAKGVEDTALYRYGRLLCLNEVGGDPRRFSLSADDFHAANLERAHRFPRHLLATSTHDSKRSGDVRARLAALSWFADDWCEQVQAWRDVNAPLKTEGVPDASEEYFLYQTLVGVWPIESHRLDAYLEKALREAKRNTSWIDPDEQWEAAVKSFARRLRQHRHFLRMFEPFVDLIARAGERVSLAQTLLKLTCPGIPDIYQGDELPSFALVDPDNRRPVDWESRQRLLRDFRHGAAPTPATAKQYLIWKTLELRRRRPDVFAEGDYEPLAAGPDVCAFLRGGQVLVAVPLRQGVAFTPPAGFESVLSAGLGVWLLER